LTQIFHQGAMVATELVQLLAEARKLARQNSMTYFGSPWNLMDVGASVGLIIGSAVHFERSADTVQLFGALGVALKWFSGQWGSLNGPRKPLERPANFIPLSITVYGGRQVS
jgi:hypothetical protein